MITLQEFKENAKKHGICEMLQDWDNAKSKKQLMDVVLNVRGVQYLANAIFDGWGMSPELIAEDFKPFNNGRYTYRKGYTSQMYCLPEEDTITIDSTVTLIIGFNGIVVIDRPVCELYLVNCNCTIDGKGIGYVYAYDSEVEHPNVPIVVKINLKK